MQHYVDQRTRFGACDMKKLVILSIALMMSGCYVHYPSIGVPGDRVKETSWRGESKVRCCYIVHNIDTGLKDYDCQEMYPSECADLRRGD